MAHAKVNSDTVQRGDMVAKRARGPYAAVTSVQVLPSGQRRLWLAGGGYLRGAKVYAQNAAASATLNNVSRTQQRQTKNTSNSPKGRKGANMATGNTNSAKRKAANLKAGKCSICGEKPKTLYAVVTEDGEVKVVRAREGRAPYCKAHAERKKAVREYKQGTSKPKAKSSRKRSSAKAKASTTRKRSTRSSNGAKPKRARKATTATAKKAKAAPKRKRAAAKPKAGAASGSGDPF